MSLLAALTIAVILAILSTPVIGLNRPAVTLRARPRVWALALLVCVVACASPARKTSDAPIASDEPPPRFATGGPDAEELGASLGYPKGTPATFWRVRWQVGSFSHFDEIFRGRLIHGAPTPSRLVRVAEPRITWTSAGGDLTLDDYLSRNPTTGLLIARGDTIFVERYQYNRTDRHRFTSFSMAKTVTAMLIGIAIDEGRIRSVDDLAAAYVPALAGTEYGRTSLRHLLQMSSGVRFNEHSSPGFTSHDVLQLILDTYMRVDPGGIGAVMPFNDRVRPAGTQFAYASVEGQVLGLVLARAIGRPVAEYLQEKIWQPIGAEADATWLVDNSGQEATYCCLNAVLRDYARLGLLLAHAATGADARSSRARGFRLQPPCTRTTRICGRARPRQTRATATRRGSSPASAGCSCSMARTGSGSTSIPGASSSW